MIFSSSALICLLILSLVEGFRHTEGHMNLFWWMVISTILLILGCWRLIHNIKDMKISNVKGNI
jgi:hypothetical protein